MIEVNLRPGTAKKRGDRKSIRMPAKSGRGRKSRGSGGSVVDRWALFMVLGWIVGPAAVIWLFLGASNRRADLNASIDQAVQDSTRFARLIEAQDRLRARRDTIQQKLSMIQEIDAGRYVWPHIMDELSRALPEYTWLTTISQLDTDTPLPEFQIVGRTGSTFALTRFMKDLEASPFIHAVRLSTTQRVDAGDGNFVQEFILVAQYENPPVELIDMVPLFTTGEE